MGRRLGATKEETPRPETTLIGILLAGMEQRTKELLITSRLSGWERIEKEGTRLLAGAWLIGGRANTTCLGKHMLSVWVVQLHIGVQNQPNLSARARAGSKYGAAT